MIPKVTQPLAKAIRTLEGWVFAVATAVPWVISLVPSTHLPTHVAAEWSAISAIGLGASRTALKIVSMVKGATGIAPAPVDLEALAKSVAEKIDISHLPTTEQLQAAIVEAIKLALQAAGVNPPPVPS
jgi:hypothetical protein